MKKQYFFLTISLRKCLLLFVKNHTSKQFIKVFVHRGPCVHFLVFSCVVRLVARILWRLDKDGSTVSDMQLTTLDELEDHITDMQEDELKELKVDIHNFLDFWPRTSKQHTVDDISHIFGVVRQKKAQ